MNLVSMLAAGFLLLVSTSAAVAQTDCTKLVPPSPWGPNDQTGATNRVTPAVTKAAAAEIQEGKVVPMSYPLVDGVPLFGTRFTKTILTATSLASGAAFGENELTYMEDTWLSQSHVGTHLDGMGHIGRKDCYFNQIAMGKFINQNMITKLGLEHLKSFATRGVLVDAVKVFQQAGKLKTNPACKKPCLDKGTLITAAAGTVLNGGTDTIPSALGEKTFHPFGDFLLHNVGTGDGIVMAMPEHYGPSVYKIVWREFSIDSVGRTRNKVRTAPLWGVRLRPRLMHDAASLTLRDAIVRHRGEASDASNRFRKLSASDQAAVIEFLKSL